MNQETMALYFYYIDNLIIKIDFIYRNTLPAVFINLAVNKGNVFEWELL